MQMPLVTTVIPTRNRHELLLRAVHSALSQTYANLEVVVVIDGPDPATEAALGAIGEERLRVVTLPQSVGGSDARNMGVQQAQGEWIAFLDDDDEWMPAKIEKQLDRALRSTSPNPVVACQVIGRTPKRDYVWPRRFPGREEALSEYLFARNTWFRGEGQIQTSMILSRRELMLSVPFTSGMPRHQDSDWYVRIATRRDVAIEFVNEPLAIWYLEENRPSIVRRSNWKCSHSWLNRVRPLITRRAYSGFIATQLAGEAAAQQAWPAFFFLLSDMFRFGKPKFLDLAIYLGNWLMPQRLRSSLRSVLARQA
jgi:glycosyltransferase involved in cell wall biosynthesis